MSQNIQNIKKQTIDIQPVRPTELCGKVKSEKNGYKSAKTSLFFSDVVDADHHLKQLFVYKQRPKFSLKLVHPYDPYAACWFPLV